jgi:hypothetical protein
VLVAWRGEAAALHRAAHFAQTQPGRPAVGQAHCHWLLWWHETLNFKRCQSEAK